MLTQHRDGLASSFGARRPAWFALALAVVSVATAGVVSGVGPPAQDPGAEALRVGGQILVEGGGPLAGARLRTDALRGPMAAQFVAQREFTTTSGATGDWSILGLTRGLWIFEVTAPGHFPHVVIVPIAMMLKPDPIPWDTSLALLPLEAIALPEGATAEPERSVFEAAERALARDAPAARRALRRLTGASLHAGSLVVAGDVALLLRDVGMARGFFGLAAKAAPDWYRPQIGIASAAMLTFDADVAIKAYIEARSKTRNTRLQQMLSSAVRDLQQIRSIGR